METIFKYALGIMSIIILTTSCDSGITDNNYKQTNSNYNIHTNNIPSNYQHNSQNQIDLDELLQQSKTAGYYTVITNLNVRATPSNKGKNLGQFTYGQMVYVSEFQGEWAVVKIQLDNLTSQKAFIHRSYIKEVSIYNQNNYSTGFRKKQNYKTYEYGVSGYGDNGYVYGDITVDRDNGDGYIYDEDGNEKWIDVEWTGNGTLEGYDEDGNYYDLDVD